MVRQCYVCKAYDYKPEAQRLTFHRFPLSGERRQLWLSALGYNDNHQFPKRVEICSKHFSASDFSFKDDGSKSLNRDAVPILVHSAFKTSSSRTSR
ncbi:unnamed protein product [Callosobruchus maculatus]|uniref:THAP-type domain-containing protein n=1 Tax=Callosobruchus maculatus TaxID=64391 RepID=A0A653DR34_CALMS|nr:unnamed protein product [Callosobruchus maculatus]